MVHTVAMHEATLVDGMVKFVAEDLNSLDTEADWWHQRVRLVEHWLRDETSRVCIPDDGTEEMIRRHIQRGDSFPKAKYKCWKYIVAELRELPCFAGVIAQLKAHDATHTSPSRGKLRPGKDLIVLSDSKSETISTASTQDDDNNNNNNVSSSWSLETLVGNKSAMKKPRPQSSAAYLSHRGLGIEAATVVSIGKSFTEMSLLERQMKWLKKKQDKMEVERLRQTRESERELTFQPKLIRRITYAGDRHFREVSPASGANRSFTRSESSRRIEDTGGAMLLKERTMPKVPRLSHYRRLKKKTPLQSASTFQPVGVASKLLDNMKSELQASLASARSNVADPERSINAENGSDSAHFIEDDILLPHNGNNSAVDSHVPALDVSTVEEDVNVPENVPAWSSRPTIGGRRADFDSSETKVRLILQDAAKFELSSMYRKTDRRAGRDGVALHVGRREDTFEEQVIAVLFDREKVTEVEAESWWTNHQHRFAEFIEPLRSSEEVVGIMSNRANSVTRNH